MSTTIQISDNVKSVLDRIKTSKETYEQVILNLMEIAEKYKREQEQLLIEGCKEMYNDMLNTAKEWEGTLMDGLDKNEKWSEL